MPSRASRQFNALINGEKTGNSTWSVPKSMRKQYKNIIADTFQIGKMWTIPSLSDVAPTFRPIAEEHKLMIEDPEIRHVTHGYTGTSYDHTSKQQDNLGLKNVEVYHIRPRHETYERWDNQQRSIVSDESLYDKQLTKVADAPALLLSLSDIPPNYGQMDQPQKDRFYPDGYAIHYFNGVEGFTLKDGTEGKLHGQLFCYKSDDMVSYYYYIFEVYDPTSPKVLYDDKVFYLLTKEQFESFEPKKSY